MYGLNLWAINSALVKAIKLCGAARRVIGKGRDGYVEVMDIEREMREAGAECQRVIGLVEADANRPLIAGD